MFVTVPMKLYSNLMGKILYNNFIETTGTDDSIILTSATDKRWQRELFEESWTLYFYD